MGVVQSRHGTLLASKVGGPWPRPTQRGTTDHVRTQLPLALAAASVGAGASTLAAAWVL